MWGARTDRVGSTTRNGPEDFARVGGNRQNGQLINTRLLTQFFHANLSSAEEDVSDATPERQRPKTFGNRLTGAQLGAKNSEIARPPVGSDIYLFPPMLGADRSWKMLTKFETTFKSRANQRDSNQRHRKCWENLEGVRSTAPKIRRKRVTHPRRMPHGLVALDRFNWNKQKALSKSPK